MYYSLITRYYEVLCYHPRDLHLYYDKEATFKHGDSDILIGKDNIKQQASSLTYMKEAKIHLSKDAIDVQVMDADRLIALVVGVIDQPAASSLPFTQSFVIQNKQPFRINHSTFRIMSPSSLVFPKCSSLDAATTGIDDVHITSSETDDSDCCAKTNFAQSSLHKRICQEPTCQNKGTQKCAECKRVYYCGVECQRLNWRAHRSECRSAHAGDTALAEGNAEALHTPLRA